MNSTVLPRLGASRKALKLSDIALLCALLVAWLLANASQAVAATKIYKTIDADGNVVYTDVAPAQRQQEAELKVEELNTFTNPEPEPAELPVVVLKDEEKADDSQDIPAYTDIRITSPSNDAPLRANNGNISLQASVEPELHPTHQLRFYLDGNPVGTVAGTNLAVNNVDRGTHQAKVAVVDSTGAVILESTISTFHLLRHSIKAPPVVRRQQ